MHTNRRLLKIESALSIALSFIRDIFEISRLKKVLTKFVIYVDVESSLLRELLTGLQGKMDVNKAGKARAQNIVLTIHSKFKSNSFSITADIILPNKYSKA